MALEYTLYIVTELKPQELVELIFESMELKYKIEGSTESDIITFTTESGFLTYAKYASQSQRRLIKEELDIIEPSVHILFRLDKFQDRAIVKKKLILFVKAILKETQRDCVFLFNHEDVLLIRDSGEISINQNSGFWTSEYLELLNEPFEMKQFDSI